MVDDPYTRASRQPSCRSDAVTTHNTNPLPVVSDELYVGVGGDITMRLEKDASDRTFKNVIQGSTLYLRATHIRTTGTTATNLIAIYYQ
jgi:hypothetical protein